jgi:phosphatidylglycerophosphate synthase
MSAKMSVSSSSPSHAPELPWKLQVEDPLNRFYRYPAARALVRLLVRTPISANQVTLVQPAFALGAAWLLQRSDPRALVLAALLLEIRGILDCADGELARAKKTSSPMGHALDGLVDWLCVAILYVGLWLRLRAMPDVALGASHLGPTALLVIVLLQAALRSASADYFKQKYGAIFATGRDPTDRELAHKLRAAQADGAGFLLKAEATIHRLEHLFFDLEWFRLDAREHSPSEDEPRHPLADARETPAIRAIGWTWALSNGDAFLSLVTLAMACNRLWEAQLFFASIGPLWILAVLVANGLFLSRARRAQAIG